MLPFYVAGLVVLYGINAGANAMMGCELKITKILHRRRRGSDMLADKSITSSGRIQERSPKPQCEETGCLRLRTICECGFLGRRLREAILVHALALKKLEIIPIVHTTMTSIEMAGQ